MKHTKKKILAIAITAAMCAPMAAMATNGYFGHGYGTKNKGLAGGGAALAQDSMIAATNPAGMVFVGNRLDVGVAIFSPNPRSYTTTGSAGVPDGAACGMNCPFEIGPQSIDSEDDVFLIPHFGRNWMLDANSSIGISVYGNGGMNTEYKGGTAQHNDGVGNAVTTPGTFGAGTTGINLEQLFIAGTYARKINDKASWGVTPIFVYQKFEAKGLGMFAGYSTDPTNVTNNGVDTSTGYGLKLGVQGEAAPGVTLAASYQSKMSMSEFDDYAGLFAEEGGFDIPATATLGVAWATSPSTVLTVDVQKIYYGTVDSIANPVAGLLTGCATGADATQCLGGSNGAGFGYEDMTIVKLGYQWAGSNGWTWRAGLSKGDQPIPKEEVMFNILAPAVMEKHVTFGFTKEVGTDNEFNFAAMYAPNVSVKGTNPMDPAQTIEIEMSQWELEGSWAIKF
ncbi:MAG: outer membrane protein transport protein [Deltaproteobacteria bacterium]|nr:outer membrane protein transport protein [Deltaproteobacteria bacterium]